MKTRCGQSIVPKKVKTDIFISTEFTMVVAKWHVRRTSGAPEALAVALSFCCLLGLECPKQAFAKIANHRKLGAGSVTLPQMTGRRVGMPFVLSTPSLALRFRQNNGPTGNHSAHFFDFHHGSVF
jgi:hypothetical protein